MNQKSAVLIVLALAAMLLAACSPVAAPAVEFDPGELRFSGAQAFQFEEEFVTRFTNRHSGAPNNRAAAEFLFEHFSGLGLDCEMQEWMLVNYSQPTDFQNVACMLPGRSPQQILIVAHHDQASTTVQGADNDGSGIAILVQLAEIFAAEGEPAYTLTFVSTDGEEYGMLGTRHYMATHPDAEEILAGFSMDNLGHGYYDAMNMELIGQYRNYGPTWLALALREAAAAVPGGWAVNLRSPVNQVLDQAGPISFMDQGPLIAAGVPAVGLTAHVPPQYAELHFQLWHDPGDTMEHQSAESLGQAGRVAEAFTRQLLSMEEFPRELGPYMYFDYNRTVLRGAPLWLIFVAFTAVYFAGSARTLRAPWQERLAGWRHALPHLLSLWLPLLGAIVMTYLFVEIGAMDQYAVYPATSKDPLIYNPRWPAMIGFLLSLAAFLYLGRRLAARSLGVEPPAFNEVRSLALLVIGLGGLYVLWANAFSLLFMLPTLFWLLIRGRGGPGRALDILLFILGGLVFYGLFYFFGFVIYDYNFAFAWFLLLMFSIRMISFPTAVAITAIVGAGLSLVEKASGDSP